MKYTKLFAVLALVTASSVLVAQSSTSSSSLLDPDATAGGSRASATSKPAFAAASAGALSKVALGVGVSPLGIQLGLTTSLNPHLNVRATGNMFNYSTNFTTSGIAANAKLDLKSAGASLDIYPFGAGLRISPGVLFYNGNEVTATANVPGGTSFTLNNQKYYSANANTATGATPINGNALLSLHTTNPAFTFTTGWGNTLPRKGHWSFPFEVGVAVTGAPSLNVNLGGWACYDQAQTICTDINNPTNPIAQQIQSNLHTQVAKWTKDVEPLKTYPIVSFGVDYKFKLRSK